MPSDPRKHQKKQERRSAKRKARHQSMAKEKSGGLAARLTEAAQFPVTGCWATMVLWDRGLGTIILSRALPNGSVAFASFLVDRYCLGVKDAMGNVLGRFTYESNVVRKTRARFGYRDLSPATARKFVESAVAYARSLGFQPHPDYLKAKHIFGDIDASTSSEELEFGKDGKPFFIAGPYDDRRRCDQVISTLEASCGPDGFHYLVASDQWNEDFEEFLEEDEEFD